MGFIRSLVTERAGQFSESITRNLSRATEAVGSNISRAGEFVEHAVGQVPDMILPEDAGNVGSQIMGEVSDIAPAQSLRTAADQAHRVSSGASAIARETTREIRDINPLPGQGELLQTQEIMRRRLNNFQIERLAEQIKERLESEMKVERERHGEEP